MSATIRKIVTVVEETHLEMGQAVTPPTRRAAAIAVIENPFAGRYVEDLSPLIAIGEELGELLSKKAVAALGIDGAALRLQGETVIVAATEHEMLRSETVDNSRIWEEAAHA